MQMSIFHLSQNTVLIPYKPSNMADEKVVTLDGKPINELRVVDLKKALEQRNLSKSGSKKDLLERLRNVSTKTLGVPLTK